VSPRAPLPAALTNAADHARLAAAIIAVRGAGAALVAVRGSTGKGREEGDQLKTAIDRAAEGWALGYLEAAFPEDTFLAEERFDASGGVWGGASSYWTVDALDGTRSYIDGFDGFCVQVAFVRDGAPVVAAIEEPTAGATYVAIAGAGAYLLHGGTCTKLSRDALSGWPEAPRFVDSTPPGGPVGALSATHGGRFVELGSIGLKALRIADGRADVYAKELRFKLWDAAPADLVLRESGGRLGTWSGAPIPYLGNEVALRRILAAPNGLFELCAAELARHDVNAAR